VSELLQMYMYSCSNQSYCGS